MRKTKVAPNIRKRKPGLVLVTGGTSGIGFAVLQRFIAGGWDILCHYNSNHSKADKIRQEAVSTGVQCETVQADLSIEKGIEKLIGCIRKQPVDSVINNAGAYLSQKHFSEVSLTDLMPSFTVNLAAPFILSSCVFPAMCSQGFGRIINISSIAAKYGGSAFSMHYGCFKRGLEGITRTLAREGAAQGVLVNSIRPGVIDTAFHRKYPKNMQSRLELIPAKRMGRPEEAAELIFYLGSEKNTYITGQTVAVSGGE